MTTSTTSTSQIVQGETLPEEEDVFRLLKASKDGRAIETHFTLSEKDKVGERPLLSVWAIRFTTPQQAIEFIEEEKRGSYQLYAIMNVGKIRAFRPEPDASDITPYLDVIGDPLKDNRPGADGHCGITGLKRQGLEFNSKRYKSLRYQLTDLANCNCQSV